MLDLDEDNGLSDDDNGLRDKELKNLEHLEEGSKPKDGSYFVDSKPSKSHPMPMSPSKLPRYPNIAKSKRNEERDDVENKNKKTRSTKINAVSKKSCDNSVQDDDTEKTNNVSKKSVMRKKEINENAKNGEDLQPVFCSDNEHDRIEKPSTHNNKSTNPLSKENSSPSKKIVMKLKNDEKSDMMKKSKKMVKPLTREDSSEDSFDHRTKSISPSKRSSSPKKNPGRLGNGIKSNTKSNNSNQDSPVKSSQNKSSPAKKNTKKSEKKKERNRKISSSEDENSLDVEKPDSKLTNSPTKSKSLLSQSKRSPAKMSPKKSDRKKDKNRHISSSDDEDSLNGDKVDKNAKNQKIGRSTSESPVKRSPRKVIETKFIKIY